VLIDFNEITQVKRWPVEAIRVSTGVGKTTIMVKTIADSVNAGEMPKRPWVYLVPTHRLGDEIVEMFAQHGVNAKVWRGRSAQAPGDPDRTMCNRLDAVKLAVKAGLPVSETCCKSKKKGKTKQCPFFSVCAYQKQKNTTPDVWIAAHETLFHDNESFGDPAGVIVDESFWQDGLRLPSWGIPIANIRNDLIPPAGKEDSAADLNALRNTLADALESNGDGPLVCKHVTDRLSLRECTEAIKLEWHMMPGANLEPGATDSDLRKFKKEQLPRIQAARRMVAVWRAVRNMLDRIDVRVSGHAYVEKGEVKVRGVSPIRDRWQVPTMIIDATLPDIEILRAYYPQAEIVGDWSVSMPHVKVRQFLNGPVTQERLMKTETDRNRKAIRRHIVKRYLETGRQKTLVICQMEYQEWLAASDLPDNIHVEHFNAISGLDGYKDVRRLISIGRTLPGPIAVENMAAALTGKEPIRVQGQDNGRRWYVPQVRGASVWDEAKGKTVGKAVQCYVHPDMRGRDCPSDRSGARSQSDGRYAPGHRYPGQRGRAGSAERHPDMARGFDPLRQPACRDGSYLSGRYGAVLS
jgi:putative DNA primase/helicase